MNTTHLIFVVIFLLLSYADLRYRTAPGIEFVFLGAVALTVSDDPFLAMAVVLAVGWGWLKSWPNTVMLPLLFYPAAWPVLLTGTGTRFGMIGRSDLLAAGSLAMVFPWPALVFAFISLEGWRRWWQKRYASSPAIPALPGLMIGISLYVAAITLLEVVG